MPVRCQPAPSGKQSLFPRPSLTLPWHLTDIPTIPPCARERCPRPWQGRARSLGEQSPFPRPTPTPARPPPLRPPPRAAPMGRRYANERRQKPAIGRLGPVCPRARRRLGVHRGLPEPPPARNRAGCWGPTARSGPSALRGSVPHTECLLAQRTCPPCGLPGELKEGPKLNSPSVSVTCPISFKTNSSLRESLSNRHKPLFRGQVLSFCKPGTSANQKQVSRVRANSSMRINSEATVVSAAGKKTPN